jgi:hypothetical protein
MMCALLLLFKEAVHRLAVASAEIEKQSHLPISWQDSYELPSAPIAFKAARDSNVDGT